MKTLTYAINIVLLTVCLTAAVNAEMLTERYGVNIVDNGLYQSANADRPLFELFNKYFEEQLGGNQVSSSNALFNERGVNPATDWVTSGSQIVGAFKVAAFSHDFKVVSNSGNNAGDVLGGVYNIGSGVNVVDGSGANGGIADVTAVSLADGNHIDFMLQATFSGWDLNGFDYSSHKEDNADGRLHMLAFDITDLYNAKYNTNLDSAYMLAWEDILEGNGIGLNVDWDFQDLVMIVTNITPNEPTPSATPEPATMLIFGFGMAGAGVAAYRRRRK
jgi:hypothetical protein